MEQLQGLFPFKLDGFQEKAVQQLLEGRSVVVCAPTGAGKTAIAEAAAAAALARGQRVIYTTPLKALSNQKLAEKAARFGSSRVGLQTGDTSLNTDADIVVMTTEILRNIMYRTAEIAGSGSLTNTRDERLGDVGLVVLDEVHYLGDPWRGSVWEEVIINCPRHIQMLAMSATVKNPEDLGGWISQVHGECVTIKTRFRPVPLRWVFCHKAPRQGAVLEDLTLQQQQQQQQQQGGAAAIGRLNPRLKMDEWVEEELKFQAMKEARAAREAAQRQQNFYGGGYDSDPYSSSSSNGSRRGSRGSGGGYRSSGGSSSSSIEEELLAQMTVETGDGGGGGKFGGGGRRGNERQDLVRKVMGKRTPTQEQVVRQLIQARMLPAIWFIMSRRDCDLAAIATNVALVDQQEEAELEQELMQLFSDNPDAVRDKLVPAFLRGIASHHAGCLPAWKSLVERCFQKGLLKLVYATGTLAAGINMPARTTVISNLARRSDDGIKLLPHNELLQMAGRAGRRGFDTLGHCVLVQGRFEGAEAAHGIITGGPEPLQSQFTTSYSLVLNLLSVYSLDEARDFLSKSFGTYLQEQGNTKLRQQAQQLMDTAAALLKLAEGQGGSSMSAQQKAAVAAVKRHKSLLLRLREKATAERCTAVGQMLAPPSAADAADAAAAAAAAAAPDSSSNSSAVGLPALLLLNLSRHPNDYSQPPEYLPALAVAVTDRPPFEPLSSRDLPQPPVIMCLGADNRPLAVSGQHVVGVLRDQTVLQEKVLQGQDETLAKLHAVLDDAAENKKVWANLLSRMFSCQVTFGSALTSALALKLNLPLDVFDPVMPSPETAAQIEEQKTQLQEAKQSLATLRRQDKFAAQSVAQQQQALLQGVPQEALAAAVAAAAGDQPDAAAAGGSRQRSSSSDNGSSGSSSSDDEVAAALKSLQGRDPLVVAKRLAKRAKRMMAEADQGQSVTTWNSFMDVLSILVEMGAMEESSLRLLPLGLVARSINCNNELWMAAALSSPGVMALSPPQLAALVGALQCTDLLKRPMSIWSSYQVSDAVITALEELEPTMEAIYNAQTAAGQGKWNEHLAVDLRLAGLVEAWAGGASWQEIMADTSIDDGDMARLMARTADMLKQMTFLHEQLPYLTEPARAALRGMNRKPISDLVA
ncbi:hypothetical protein OEZ86_007879 [Tetradesmus obliquus]|nr:hypothetical protein OEZ86_007879 [Tetradesmus obliquus]